MEMNLNGYPTPGLPEELLPGTAKKSGDVQLAMVYAPDQVFGGLYDPAKALMRGTLFEKLDKPLALGGKNR